MPETPSDRPDPWSEAETVDFLDAGSWFVPERTTQIDTIASVVPPSSDPVHLVELCCGEGLLAEALAERFPAATVHAFDRSKIMLSETKRRLDRFPDRFEIRRFRLTETEWREFPWPVHAVVSSLAVHHLDAPAKRTLYRDMAAALAPSGALVICDLVEPLTDEGRELYARHWEAAVRKRSLESEGDLARFEFFREAGWNHYRTPDEGDVPSPLVDQLDWLRDVGLEKTEVHWLQAGHAIFSGRKPA